MNATTVRRYFEYECKSCGESVQADEMPCDPERYCVNCVPVPSCDSVPRGIVGLATPRRRVNDERIWDGVSDVMDLLCDIAHAHELHTDAGEKRALEAGEEAMAICLKLKGLVGR